MGSKFTRCKHNQESKKLKPISVQSRNICNSTGLQTIQTLKRESKMLWNSHEMKQNHDAIVHHYRVPDFKNNPTKIFMDRNKIDNPPFFFNKNTPVSQCLTISASSNIMTPIIWSTHQPFTTSAPKTKHKYYITSR